VHHYDGRRGPIYHVDCYRLARPDDARDLDWETLVAGDALLIEWPERAGAWAPRPTHRVHLAHTSHADLRRVEVS
jgi:tRNA threonylcarbamoyladenosine biosynthesis protein TsaE